MDGLTITSSVVAVATSLLSVFIASVSLKRNERLDAKNEGKHQGSIFSDLGYIKACVDRVEKNLSKVDESYKDILERLAKVEETVKQITKRIDKGG